jgi:hypothetical protein
MTGPSGVEVPAPFGQLSAAGKTIGADELRAP